MNRKLSKAPLAGAIVVIQLFVVACGGAASPTPVPQPTAATTAAATTAAATTAAATTATATTAAATMAAATMAPATATSGLSTGSPTADLSYVAAQVNKYLAKPTFEAPGPAFDAPSAMQGKTIFTLPYSNAIPFDIGLLTGQDNAAKLVGFTHTTWTNQGSPSEWNQGLQSAIATKVDLIDILTINPNVFEPTIKDARSQGIKVVDSHVYALGQQAPDFLDGVVRFDYEGAGRLLADWVINTTQGKSKVLILEASDSVSSPPFVAAIEDEFKTRCGSGCELLKADVPTSDWATRITPTVQAQVVANPDLNYIIPIYDSMSPQVVAALAATNTADTVKIATFNGSASVIDLVREGKVEMDIGENLVWAGMAIMDSEMRLLAGQAMPDDPKIPMYIFTKDNAAEAGTPAQIGQGYGNAQDAGYHDLWQLK